MKKILSFCFAFSLALIVFLSITLLHYKEKSKSGYNVEFPLNETALEKKLQNPPSLWVEEQIQSDLKLYRKNGISKKMLDAVFQAPLIEKLNLVRFTIKNRSLSFSLSEKNLDSRQFRHLLGFFKKLNTLVPLPDVDFIISLEDSINEDLGAPLFVYAKPDFVNSLVLIPDFKALTGYPRLRRQMEEGSQNCPWETKSAKAFWRGSTTGGWLSVSNWSELPRVKLALLSSSHPEKIDARVTGVVQADPEIPALIREKGLLAQKAGQKKHLQYKYLIDVDGNSCSFERYFWTLLSNSVVLKQQTPNVQWYYRGLKAFEHFIPVKEDLSNLLDQIVWAQNHDAEAKLIAEQATRFVKEELSQEDVFLYMALLLKEYAKLQSEEFAPQVQ